MATTQLSQVKDLTTLRELTQHRLNTLKLKAGAFFFVEKAADGEPVLVIGGLGLDEVEPALHRLANTGASGVRAVGFYTLEGTTLSLEVTGQVAIPSGALRTCGREINAGFQVRSTLVIADKRAQQREKFLQTYSTPLARTLVGGLDPETQSAGQMAEQLLENFKKIGFVYTISTGPGGAGLLNGSATGHCGTLAEAFCIVMREYCGVAAEQASFDEPFLTAGAATIDRSRTGNCHGGRFWFFGGHTWARVGGRDYDVLFARSPLAKMLPATKVTPELGSISYQCGEHKVWGPYKEGTGKMDPDAHSIGDAPDPTYVQPVPIVDPQVEKAERARRSAIFMFSEVLMENKHYTKGPDAAKRIATTVHDKLLATEKVEDYELFEEMGKLTSVEEMNEWLVGLLKRCDL